MFTQLGVFVKWNPHLYSEPTHLGVGLVDEASDKPLDLFLPEAKVSIGGIDPCCRWQP